MTNHFLYTVPSLLGNKNIKFYDETLLDQANATVILTLQDNNTTLLDQVK